MADSLYFYDLETSGISPRDARIMQFAGQRVDLDLRHIGEPDNIIVRLSEDILPEPDAILVTGITPQQTQLEGITEAEFLEYFQKEVAMPGTIFVGFNTVRFDDEFMRYTLYRNFYDPYEWQWKDGRGRWDLLDVVRMTRALRPDGIKWPVDKNGKPTNRLELLTAMNGLDHDNAHDALNDVYATIALAKLLKQKQPKLFSFLLSMRTKASVKQLVETGQPFVYSSGKYATDFEKTTVVTPVAVHPKKGGMLVYDLRHNPQDYIYMSVEQLAKAWEWKSVDSQEPRLPVKLLQYNRCPAIAPMGVLDADSQKRLSIDLSLIEKHRKVLSEATLWPERLFKALEILDTAQQARLLSDQQSADSQLYDGFFGDTDRQLLPKIRHAPSDELNTFTDVLHDDRLKQLLPLYKARNFSNRLSDEERAAWDTYKTKRLFDGGPQSRLARYFKRIEELSKESRLTQNQKFLLEDLNLYGQSLVPPDYDA